ncbi:MAG: hypothetical protein RLZZ501_957 [Pseudomonadota bacterium]
MDRDRALAAAIADLAAGRVEAAESACALILSDHPDDGDALNLMAVLLCRREEFDPAMDLLVRVLEQRPDDVQALTTMGDALFVLEEFDGAAECFRRAAAARPDQGTPVLRQGQALRRADRPAEALPCYLAAIARGAGGGQTLAELGEVLTALGRPAEAAEAFRAAAALAPGQAGDWEWIGGVLAGFAPAAPAVPASLAAAPHPAADPAAIPILTGGNAAVFGQMIPLLQAFDGFGRRDRLMVADFGLTADQRAFRAGRGQLRQSRWSEVAAVQAWWCKAALVDYLTPDEGGLIWIDADMFPPRDPVPEFESLLAEMAAAGQTVAAAHDSASTIGDLLHFSAQRRLDCAPFQHLLLQYGVDLARRYLNSGLILARDRAVLEQWRRMAHANARGFLWEQNAFNVAAWRDPARLRQLAPRIWNVQGALLGAVREQDGEIRCDGEPVTIIHATTPLPGQFDEVALRWRANGRIQEGGTVRLLTNPALRRRQNALIAAFFAANGWEPA